MLSALASLRREPSRDTIGRIDGRTTSTGRSSGRACATNVLCFDVGGTRIKAGLVRGAEVHALTTAATAGDGATDLLSTLVQIGTRLMAGEEVSGIGLCLKGFVDPTRGILLDVDEVLAGWIGQPLAEMIAGRLGYPCLMENDARMYALGEFLHGSGRGSRNMVCLTLGTGVGSGVVLDGRVLRGRRGVAGILGGHVTVQIDGPACSCGNVGCLQALIGAAGVVDSAQRALATSHSSVLRGRPLSPQGIFAAAAGGDQLAQGEVERFASCLGAGIVTLIHAYDPDIVVLGGGLSQAWPQFLPDAQAYVDTHAWTIPRRRVRVVPSMLGDAAALVGVAALAGASDLCL